MDNKSDLMALSAISLSCEVVNKVLYSYASLDCITVFFLTFPIAVYCHMFILLGA